MSSFYEKLEYIWQKNNSLVCVGLDPDLAKLPESIKGSKYPIFEFNKQLINATKDLVCSYKPQFAYYAGQNALNELQMTMDYLKEVCPEVPVILDSKRGDIGATAMQYAKEAFDVYKADAVTVNPYMGGDTLEPFLEREDKGVIALCRTSNPGSGDLQNIIDKATGETIYMTVARKAANEWNSRKNLCLVVGATYPEELKEIRNAIGDMPLLVPGVGAQGGDAKASIENGKSSKGTGLMINSSRGIIYAFAKENKTDFAQAAREATEDLKNLLNQYR
jgi:orotidine-5'-phosphate decarboxylase